MIDWDGAGGGKLRVGLANPPDPSAPAGPPFEDCWEEGAEFVGGLLLEGEEEGEKGEGEGGDDGFVEADGLS